MSVTINSQLYLSMLIEKLCNVGKCIMVNTDGAEFIVHKDKKEEYFKICNDWEKFTGYELEHVRYTKMIARNVNNYISVTDKNVTKLKGFFEFDGFIDPTDEDKKVFQLPIHKNKSMTIVPQAVYEYFINNKTITDTIYKCDNIFKFCKGEKGKGDNTYFLIDKKTGEEKQLQKTNRYYVSTDGNFFVKRLPKLEYKTATNQMDIFGGVDDGEREAQVEAGKLCTIYNKHKAQDIHKYNIDYGYYIDECNKIIKEF